MGLPKRFPRSTCQYRPLPPLRCLAAALMVVGLANGTAAAQEVSGTFVSVEVPGASLTSARSITADGRIVGFFVDASGPHGFLLADGQFTSIDAPGARSTMAFGINNRGDVVGAWVDSAGVQRGYLWPANGTFTSLEIPGAIRTLARGINAAGDVVGVYDNPDKRRAFLLSRKAFSRSSTCPARWARR